MNQLRPVEFSLACSSFDWNVWRPWSVVRDRRRHVNATITNKYDQVIKSGDQRRALDRIVSSMPFQRPNSAHSFRLKFRVANSNEMILRLVRFIKLSASISFPKSCSRSANGI